MTRGKIKICILIFSAMFVFLLFITWQHISMFRMGYRISRLKDIVYKEEIRRQEIMKVFKEKGSLFNIELIVRDKFSMQLPDYRKCRRIDISSEKLLCSRRKKMQSLWANIKEIFAPSDVQAK